MKKSVFTKTFAIVLSALMLASVFSITAFAEEAIGYGVWVGDTEVTSLNCEDIPSVMGGKAYYDAETATLTLDNVREIRGESRKALIFSKNDLNIELIGYNSPSADYDGVHRYTGIYCWSNLTIDSGSGGGFILQGVSKAFETRGSFTLNSGVIDAMILPPQDDSFGEYNAIGIDANTVRINGGHIFFEKMNSSAYMHMNNGIYAENIYITGGTTILSRFGEGITASNIAITGGRVEIIEGREGIYAMDSFEISGNNTELYGNANGSDSAAVIAYANSPFTVGDDIEIVYPRDAKLGYAYGNWPTLTDKDGNALREVHLKTKTVQVKWYNYDGELLYESPCNVGTTPEYHFPAPEKPHTDTTYYEFTGWTPDLAPITADTSYNAEFEEKNRSIKVKVQLPTGNTDEVECDIYGKVEDVVNKVIEDNGLELDSDEIYLTTPDNEHKLHMNDTLFYMDIRDGDTIVMDYRMNVIWLNGNGKVLDSKSYITNKPEPTTKKVPVKDEDENFTYEFVKWDDGEIDGTTKTYTPIWNAIAKPTETTEATEATEITDATQPTESTEATETTEATQDTTPAPKSIKTCTVSGIKTKTYNGKAQTQTLTVKDGTTVLKKGTDYTVTYKNNINAGKAAVTIKGKGNYTGTLTKTFKINKAKNSITVSVKTKVTAKAGEKTVIKNAVKVKKAQGKVTYKTSNKKVTVKGNKLIITKGLTKGKTYKVKITISAKGNKNYNSKKLVKTIKIKVR